jgi:uncharacterized protein YdaL
MRDGVKHFSLTLLAVLLAFAAAAGVGPDASGESSRSPHDQLVSPRSSGDVPSDYGRLQKAGDELRRKNPQPKQGAVTASAPLTQSAAGAQAAPAAASTGPTTLVLYDTAGQYGYLGELYAMMTDNLAGHFGTVTAKPVSAYQAGQINDYTATIYFGSTYYGAPDANGQPIPDAIPAAFYSDVLTTTRPVVWINDNIWNLANNTPGGPAQFASTYGWDPTQSFFNFDSVTSVAYKGQTLTRSSLNTQGILNPRITDASKVTVLAQAKDDATGTSLPWAIRSGNLTYIGDIPFSYVNETDRVMILSDLLFDALAPSTPTRHRAMVRLEDISPASDPAQLTQIGNYLKRQNVPFSFGVIPVYTDPNGFDNNGTPQTIKLSQAPAVVKALKALVADGGTMVMHGYTHQYGNVANPYNGVTGDDFEFYRAQCSTTNTPPYNFTSPCQTSDWVVYRGPVTEDSASWAQGRITAGFNEFRAAGFTPPQIWEFPHYAASAVDYQTVKSNNFAARYDRTLYFKGLLSGGPIDYNRTVGQFFPYVVQDVYGQKVLPENLGNYEPEAMNHNPPRLPADLIHEAQLNLVVRDGYASFFYHPSYGVGPLQQTVPGIKKLGYTFVSPSTALGP